MINIRVKMAPVLTAGAMTTEPRYLRVPNSAGARPMRPPARAPGSADRIGRATHTTDTTHRTRSANTHELTTELSKRDEAASDSAGARLMNPPARPPGSADRIGRATHTTDT